MRTPVIGALFAGYGGLEHGVQAAIGGDVAWYSEIDRGALKILTHRYPQVANIGDITAVDWGQVEPVDVLTGGSPCQDLSHAGKRAGMTEGTRSNLWVAMREAIAQLRPGLVVWENVRGAYSSDADSALEHCPGCMGDGRPGTVLRALGRVLGDLSDLGYDAGWHGLRAADVGAPHGRFRVFVTAHPRGEAGDVGAGLRADEPARDGRRQSPRDDRSTLLPTPRATGGTKGGPNQRGSSGDLMLPSAVQHLLPTPLNSDAGPRGGTTGFGLRDWSRAHAKGEHLLPTPRSTRGGSTTETSYDLGGVRTDEHRPQGQVAVRADSWGDYGAAIARWEHILGRPAPSPTMTSAKGNPQLSPAFVEWLMGLPAGWVTDAPGITRNEALKALGNGVVPQQAEAALRFLLPVLSGVAA
jgi:DNA (cytosine-5)-methyltransferase 1